jgi:Holliday junction resolvase RusA-like endonuclease
MGMTLDEAIRCGIGHLHPDVVELNDRHRRATERPARLSTPQVAAVASPPGRWVVVIPRWAPTRLNVLMRLHWSARGRVLETEAALVALACEVAGVRPASRKRRITQRLTLTGRDKRRDDDGAWKGLLDACVKAHALVDDGPDWVEREPLQFERGTERRTMLVIEDIGT